MDEKGWRGRIAATGRATREGNGLRLIKREMIKKRKKKSGGVSERYVRGKIGTSGAHYYCINGCTSHQMPASHSRK